MKKVSLKPAENLPASSTSLTTNASENDPVVSVAKEDAPLPPETKEDGQESKSRSLESTPAADIEGTTNIAQAHSVSKPAEVCPPVFLTKKDIVQDPSDSLSYVGKDVQQFKLHSPLTPANTITEDISSETSLPSEKTVEQCISRSPTPPADAVITHPPSEAPSSAVKDTKSGDDIIEDMLYSESSPSMVKHMIQEDPSSEMDMSVKMECLSNMDDGRKSDFPSAEATMVLATNVLPSLNNSQIVVKPSQSHDSSSKEIDDNVPTTTSDSRPGIEDEKYYSYANDFVDDDMSSARVDEELEMKDQSINIVPENVAVSNNKASLKCTNLSYKTPSVRSDHGQSKLLTEETDALEMKDQTTNIVPENVAVSNNGTALKCTNLTYKTSSDAYETSSVSSGPGQSKLLLEETEPQILSTKLQSMDDLLLQNENGSSSRINTALNETLREELPFSKEVTNLITSSNQVTIAEKLPDFAIENKFNDIDPTYHARGDSWDNGVQNPQPSPPSSSDSNGMMSAGDSLQCVSSLQHFSDLSENEKKQGHEENASFNTNAPSPGVQRPTSNVSSSMETPSYEQTVSSINYSPPTSSLENMVVVDAKLPDYYNRQPEQLSTDFAYPQNDINEPLQEALSLQEDNLPYCILSSDKPSAPSEVVAPTFARLPPDELFSVLSRETSLHEDEDISSLLSESPDLSSEDLASFPPELQDVILPLTMSKQAPFSAIRNDDIAPVSMENIAFSDQTLLSEDSVLSNDAILKESLPSSRNSFFSEELSLSSGDDIIIRPAALSGDLSLPDELVGSEGSNSSNVAAFSKTSVQDDLISSQESVLSETSHSLKDSMLPSVLMDYTVTPSVTVPSESIDKTKHTPSPVEEILSAINTDYRNTQPSQQNAFAMKGSCTTSSWSTLMKTQNDDDDVITAMITDSSASASPRSEPTPDVPCCSKNTQEWKEKPEPNDSKTSKKKNNTAARSGIAACLLALSANYGSSSGEESDSSDEDNEDDMDNIIQSILAGSNDKCQSHNESVEAFRENRSAGQGYETNGFLKEIISEEDRLPSTQDDISNQSDSRSKHHVTPAKMNDAPNLFWNEDDGDYSDDLDEDDLLEWENCLDGGGF